MKPVDELTNDEARAMLELEQAHTYLDRWDVPRTYAPEGSAVGVRLSLAQRIEYHTVHMNAKSYEYRWNTTDWRKALFARMFLTARDGSVDDRP